MSQPNNEKWLWEEIRKGSEGALHDMYLDNYDLLLRYGIRITSNKVIISECINETFLEVWNKRKRLPEVENIQGYLFIIFKRKLFKKIKKNEKLSLFYKKMTFSAVQKEPSYEMLLIASQEEEEKKVRIKNVLNKLTPRQKELVELKYYKEYSIEEIAKELNLSPRTIYNTLHAAMTILRKELDDL